MVKTVYRAAILHSLSESLVDFYPTGFLSISESGHIASISHVQPDMDRGDTLVTLDNKLIMPGFVDTHAHIPQFQVVGKGRRTPKEATPLLSWLNKYIFPAEMNFKDPRIAYKISENFFRHALARGTTTIAAYSSVHKMATDEAFRAAHKQGIRAFIGKAMMDRNSPESLEEKTEVSLKESFWLFDKWEGKNNGKLRYVFTPRFAPTCTLELLTEVGNIAHRNNAYVQTHLSENEEEVGWVKELFPQSKSYTDVYAKAGLLGKKTIMAHCIHLSSEERSLLLNTGTKIAHCPDSNHNLGSGIMPYQDLRDMGLTIGLGSDVAGGRLLGMNYQMKKSRIETAKLNLHLNLSEAFYLSTLGGAHVLGMDEIVGNFQIGKEADFVVINPNYVHHTLIKNAHDALEFLMYKCRGRHFVEEVYVRGERIHSKIKH